MKTFSLLVKFSIIDSISDLKTSLHIDMNNAISGPILVALFSIRITFVSHYSAFSSARDTDANVLNC